MWECSQLVVLDRIWKVRNHSAAEVCRAPEEVPGPAAGFVKAHTLAVVDKLLEACSFDFLLWVYHRDLLPVALYFEDLDHACFPEDFVVSDHLCP